MTEHDGGDFAPALRELIVWVIALAVICLGLGAADEIWGWDGPAASTAVERSAP